MPHAAARLPLSEEIARLRAVEAAAAGYSELRTARLDLRWAEVDRARALQADAEALQVARELADAGDADAIAAVALAEELEPDPPPTAAARPAVERPREEHAGYELPDLSGFVALLAEQRRGGASFQAAWASATVRLGLREGELGRVLAITRPEWQAAFNREPAPRGLSLTPLGG